LHLFPQVYTALVKPVQAILDAAETVYIVPTGPLHYLPLGALMPDLQQAPPLLAPGRRVVYAPSATVLLTYCHTRPSSPKKGLLALAPGDPKLQFIQGAAQTLAHQGDDLPVLGPAATRQAFLAKAGDYRIVCFIGHAHFDQRYPMSSRLQLAKGNLYASEILRELRLQADLVLLAACETGRGQVLRGDEILGLTRALLYAGTPSLLVTLWPVHEIPTRLLVEKFFAQLSLHEVASGLFDPALALATAQNWLRTLSYAEAQALLADWKEELSADDIDSLLTALWQMTQPGLAPQGDSQLFVHPFFWSPYILIGDRPGN
jgi:CHAT domain-containing protein